MGTCPIFVRGNTNGKEKRTKKKNKTSAKNENIYESRPLFIGCSYTSFVWNETCRSDWVKGDMG